MFEMYIAEYDSKFTKLIFPMGELVRASISEFAGSHN